MFLPIWEPKMVSIICGACINEAKGHDREPENTPVCDESCLLPILAIHLHLVIVRESIHE